MERPDNGAVRQEVLSLLRGATSVDRQSEGASLVEPQRIDAVDDDATLQMLSETLDRLVVCGPRNRDDHYLGGTDLRVGLAQDVSVEFRCRLFSTRSVTRADPHVMAGDRQAPGEPAPQRPCSTHDPDRP
jgi:hypothetical protein